MNSLDVNKSITELAMIGWSELYFTFLQTHIGLVHDGWFYDGVDTEDMNTFFGRGATS
jgi:hypothetical protein